MPKPLLISSLLCILLVILGINRGFDVSDEGLYVLLAHPFQENEEGIFNYDLFFKAFYKFTRIQFGIVGLRILRLILYVFGALGLAVFYKNIQGGKQLSLSIFLLSLLGLFAGYGFLPASLSYNHLTVVLASFWLAILSRRNKSFGSIFLLGLILSLLVYVKITTAIILGGLTLFIMIKQKGLSWKILGLLILPFLVLEFGFYGLFDQNSISRLLDGITIQTSRPDYQNVILLKHTIVGLFWILLVFVMAWVVFEKISNPLLQWGIIFPVFVFIFFKTKITEEWNHVFLLIGAVLMAWILSKSDLYTLSKSKKGWLLLLFFIPFLLHFGSNVYWLRIGIHYAVFWILGIYFLMEEMPIKSKMRFWLGVSFMSLLLVLNGIWWHPFQQKGLWNATEPWDYLPGKTILLFPSQLEVLQNLVKETENEDQLLAVYRISGIPYLLGKTIPKNPGIWDREQLSKFFPTGYNQNRMVYYPIDSLPDNFTANPIVLYSFE